MMRETTRRSPRKLASSLALAKKRLKAEVADKSRVVSEPNEVRELNRRCCDENERLNSKVDELRECLEEAASVKCHECFHSDHGRCEAHYANCMAKKWRKALEGRNEISSNAMKNKTKRVNELEAALREALSGIDEFMTRTIYRVHGADIERWRKALEGAKDEGR